MELHGSPFCVGPNGLNAINVSSTIGQFIISIEHAIMLFVF